MLSRRRSPQHDEQASLLVSTNVDNTATVSQYTTHHVYGPRSESLWHSCLSLSLRCCSRLFLVTVCFLALSLGLSKALFWVYNQDVQRLGSNAKQEQKQRQLQPRMVRYHSENNSYRAHHEALPVPVHLDNPFDDRIVNNKVGTNDDNDRICQPMHEWQTSSYSVCNPLHEVDTLSNAVSGALVFIHCGGDRCAFKLQDRHETLVLKIPKFYKVDRGERSYAASNTDGLTMERLTKSPYILTTYGYCGLSQLIEYGDGGSIHDLIKRVRMQQSDLLDPVQKLKVALQLVSAVADLHTFEDDHKASVTHNDLCCHQFVFVDGVYKLNDFHLARFLERDRRTKETCEYPASIGRRWHVIHAPEESMKDTLDTEKADDYTIANVMYYVLTNCWIFEEISAQEGLRYLQQGKRPPFPDHVRESNDPATQALKWAIQMLWTHNVEERPSSRQVADFLLEKLHDITGERPSKNRPVRVSIPPLPPDWDYDDSDFDSNFD